MVFAGGSRGGIRPVRPKQPVAVQGGGARIVSPVGQAAKSGIRPIEAMLGSGTQTQVSTSVPTNITAKVCFLTMQINVDMIQL